MLRPIRYKFEENMISKFDHMADEENSRWLFVIVQEKLFIAQPHALSVLF